MAEAKRRARQRRLLVAGALALIVAGVVGVVFASRSPGGPGAVSSTAAGAASGRGRVGLVEAKGPTFPVRTFVLALRHERRLTVGDIEVTENGGSVVDPTLIPASQASIPASQASQDRILSNEYLLQYKSPFGPDKTIRVQVKVQGAGTAVTVYTSPALRLPAAPTNK
jgi:hypothetical protein